MKNKLIEKNGISGKKEINERAEIGGVKEMSTYTRQRKISFRIDESRYFTREKYIGHSRTGGSNHINYSSTVAQSVAFAEK